MTDFAKKAADRLNSLPPISTTTLKLIDLLSNETYQTTELSALIEADLSLAARCLKTVNAPIFGIKRTISSVPHAVTLLGARAVLDLALQLSVRGTYNQALTGYASSADDLYRHSLYSAIAARICAQRITPNTNPESAYAAALFHDVGKLVLSSFLAEKETEDPENITHFLDYEQQHFGIDHAQISAQIAQKWHLPEDLVQAISFHHQPSQALPAYRRTALAVHLGDMFAMMAGFGTQRDNMQYQMDPMIDEFVVRNRKWELETLPQIMMDIHEEYQTVMAKFNQEEQAQ